MQKVITFLLVLLMFSVLAFGQTKPVKKTNTRPPEKKKSEPFEKADVATMASQCVLIETAEGNIELEFFPESAPETVRNFLNLTAIGAFDTTTFARVVPKFIIQGGNAGSRPDLTYDLSIRMQKKIPDEPNLIKHEKGIVSMGRSDEPNSASSDFFILLTTATYLDNKFAAFARVTKGLEVVEAINQMPVDNETPKNPVSVKKAKVFTCVK